MNHIKGASVVFSVMLLFLCFKHSLASPTFIVTSNCIEAQKNISCLKINKAQQLLQAELKINQNNLAPYYFLSVAEYYRLVTSQDFSLYPEFEKNKSQRLTQLKKAPQNNPYYLYTQSEIHLQSAFLKVFKGDYVSAMLEFKSAYSLCSQNQKKFPQFMPNKKTLGMFKALLGTTPKSYKWMLNVAGLEGDYRAGMNELKAFLNTDIQPEFWIDKQAAQFYYALFELNFGDKDYAWEYTKTITTDYQSNLMSVYLRTFVDTKSGHTEDALKILAQRPKTDDYDEFVALEYYHGLCKLNNLDNTADIHFKIFVSRFKGNLFIKDAYKRLQWFYLIQGDEAKVKAYQLMIKKQGGSLNQDEKQLAYELENGLKPDLILLKAKLLFDGGYYAKAEEVIKLRNLNELKTLPHKLEYHYRLGRILQEQNKYSKAIENLGIVVNLSPQNTPYFFAPNSCLQMGYIYKKLGFNQIAKQHFNNVGKYTKAEYIQSFEIKAEKELELIK